MAKHSSTAQPVEGKPRKRTGLRRIIRITLAVCGVLAVLVAPVVIANACSRHGSSGTEQAKESQLFVTNPFELEPGLAIVKMTHQGEGDFVVNLLPMDQEESTTPERIEFFGDETGGSYTEAALALANKKGSANISRAVNIPTAGKHAFDVKASGPWTIQVEQPRPSSAPKPTRFSGNDDTATPFFQLSSGSKNITVTNPVAGDLKISLLDKDGNEVKRILGDETGQANQDEGTTISSTVDIKEDGIYLFDVQADGLWTIEIADAK
jgi:hypothetical protein